MARKARERVEKHYSMEAVTARRMRLYDGLLAGRKPCEAVQPGTGNGQEGR
jgi:hypothetical protein